MSLRGWGEFQGKSHLGEQKILFAYLELFLCMKSIWNVIFPGGWESCGPSTRTEARKPGHKGGDP